MQHGIHQGQAVRIVDELAAREGLVDFKIRHILLEIIIIIGVSLHIGISRNHEAEGAAGGIVAALAGLRLYEARHDVDEDAGREVLAGAGFLFVGVLFQEPFIHVAQAFFLGLEPV